MCLWLNKRHKQKKLWFFPFIHCSFLLLTSNSSQSCRLVYDSDTCNTLLFFLGISSLFFQPVVHKHRNQNIGRIKSISLTLSWHFLCDGNCTDAPLSMLKEITLISQMLLLSCCYTVIILEPFKFFFSFSFPPRGGLVRLFL